ncbi:glycosyltransferase [Flavobacterium luminosum]|uniref:Glycosyltransferase n=1 Tax=Flavobacterium luminosum TaxID=2949086 RepID=A0ABT0TNJ1_9FLAO|nr:glycosyltransferase [Flavobacterium sp. HXWNR70]MCL9809063.1 glycosyltransferase [Flavobacterium sp. HXWNR70]
MKLLVISSAPVVEMEGKSYLYAPYEKEMQWWAKHANTIQFCCPIWKEDRKLLIAPISFKVDSIVALQEFDITSFSNKLKAIPLAFVALVKIFKAMKQADHIHLRCPGNIALLACLVQILFPNKQKTAKYAGNWDPKSQQPWSYRLQKWILSNTFLTRNMQVLVYGEWEGSTKNIKPFFTATYSQEEARLWSLEAKVSPEESDCSSTRSAQAKQPDTRQPIALVTPIKFLFVGTLSKGKQPLYAIQLVEQLSQKGRKVNLELYGEGVLRTELEQYIAQKNLGAIVFLRGNQSKEIIRKAYQTSHFLILPSKSEGWPKVVAEALFWGCVPAASPVSCVRYMLGNGSRGVLLQEQIDQDVREIETVLNNQEVCQKMAFEGQTWSRQFTTDKFEEEIRKLLIG